MLAQAPIRIIEITDDHGAFIAPEWLARALPVHQQLRKLPDGVPGYEQKLRRVIAGGGRLCIAARGETVQGVALWRVFENTHDGIKLYVDDLVTDTVQRSTGVGRTLIAHLEAKARSLGGDVYALDSGTQRHRAHRFYFREGFAITSYSFRKTLK